VPDSFGIYELEEEKYESMLLKYKHPTAGQKLYVTQSNADGSAPFGEYRIGIDPLDSLSGSRVLAGRSSGNSSLYVSFVNDTSFAANMNVRPYYVSLGNSLESVTGVLFYSFSNWKLLPRNNNDFVGYSGPVTAEYTNDVSGDCVNANESVTFSNLSSVIADELTWDFGDGSTGSGEEVVHSYSETGSYTVTLVAKNNSDQLTGTYTDSVLVADASTDCSLGYSEIASSKASFTVYPNPTSGLLGVSLNSNDEYTLELVDLHGRLVMDKLKQEGDTQLDITDLEPGVYMLRLQTFSDSAEIHKIIRN
jgi:PKD repeat protein